MSDPQRPHGLQPTRLLLPWDFPGKSTGVGCHCLLRLEQSKKRKKKSHCLGIFGIGRVPTPCRQACCYWWRQEERRKSSTFSLCHTFQFPASISPCSNQGGSQSGEVALHAPLPCSARLSTAQERAECKQVKGKLNLLATFNAETFSPSLTTHAQSPY